MLNLSPMRGRLIVRPDPKREHQGTLWIPKEAQKQLYSGEVLAKGSPWIDTKGKAHPTDVAVGDRIIYRKFTGHDVDATFLDAPTRAQFELAGEDGVLEFLWFDAVLAIIPKGVDISYKDYKERDVYSEEETEIEELDS